MVGKFSSQSQPSTASRVVWRTSSLSQRPTAPKVVRHPSPFVNESRAVPVEMNAGAAQSVCVPPISAKVAPPESPMMTKAASSSSMMRLWVWVVMMLAGTSVSTGSAAIAFNLLIALPPETDCHANLPDADRNILSCGYQAMQTDNIETVVTSLAHIDQWTVADPLYEEAREAAEQWSWAILQQAEHRVRQNQLVEAIALINYIPSGSPLYSAAQYRLNQLKQQQSVIQPLVDMAHVAMQHQDWQQVQQHIKTLAQVSKPTVVEKTRPDQVATEQDEWFQFFQYQSFHIEQLSERLRMEQNSAIVLQQVRKTAVTGIPQSIALALQRAKDINAATYVWTESQTNLELLATELLNHAEGQCLQGDLVGAIASARQAAIIPALAEEAGYLEQLCQAKQLAIATMTPWKPSVQDSLQLMEACALLEAIPPSSRFYSHTHHHLRQWRSHLDDLRHLHLAHLSASIGWSPTLAWAVQQTEQVAPERPRRIQAQTLAAHWKQQLENIQQAQNFTWSSQRLLVQ